MSALSIEDPELELPATPVQADKRGFKFETQKS